MLVQAASELTYGIIPKHQFREVFGRISQRELEKLNLPRSLLQMCHLPTTTRELLAASIPHNGFSAGWFERRSIHTASIISSTTGLGLS
jgi:hypothetical protein